MRHRYLVAYTDTNGHLRVLGLGKAYATHQAAEHMAARWREREPRYFDGGQRPYKSARVYRLKRSRLREWWGSVRS
jgi:hypothetical protein